MAEQTATQVDDVEQAARVVEAFAEGEVDETRELLDQIAAAIRGHA